MSAVTFAALASSLLICAPSLAFATDDTTIPADETVALHGQATLVEQGNGSFRSPYQGPNSFDSGAKGRETFDATLYAGIRPWAGAEIWINPEIDQGFGLSNSLGIAGFPSAEAYKVGKSSPYLKFPRAFLRQTFNLSGASSEVEGDINQLAGRQTQNRLVITIGKFSTVDIFDANSYAHDPRGDFLNWSLVDTGTFDYGGNGWGYTYGLASELYLGRWTLRGGVFDMSRSPGDAALDPSFNQFELDGEVEERHSLAGQPGAIKITVFDTRGDIGAFADAIALSQVTGQPADIAAVRRYRSRTGVNLSLQQQLTANLGVFVRAGLDDGNLETFDFTDVDRTVAAGLSWRGKVWGRPDDTIGLAGVDNGISHIHEQFLADGGKGILVGDGQLPHPGDERILETYYDWAVGKHLAVTLDYQFIANPAYNRDRGPVSLGAVRVHAQF
jgi:high affinity Mn2+ porin